MKLVRPRGPSELPVNRMIAVEVITAEVSGLSRDELCRRVWSKPMVSREGTLHQWRGLAKIYIDLKSILHAATGQTRGVQTRRQRKGPSERPAI